jgi:hypothetical protein
LHRRVERLSSVPLLGALLLAGCTQASPSSGATSKGPETSTQASTSMSGTGRGLPTSTDPVSCSLDDSPSHAIVTRWSTPSRSIWWVTYDVINNNCLGPVALTGISLAGPMRAGDGVVNLGSVQAVPLTGSAPPTLYTPEGSPPIGGFGLPTMVASKSSTSIVVQITLPNLGTEPSHIPKLRLAYVVTGGHEHILELSQDLRFCSCPPPTSPSP